MTCGVAAEISHQLHSCLNDVRCERISLSVDSAVIALVWLGELGELAVCPVELARINDNSAALNSVTVHVLCGRVDNNVSAPLDRTAKVRCCERVVDDKRNTVVVSYLCKLFDIKNSKCGVCQSLAEHSLGVWLERSPYLLLGSVCVNENALDTQLLERVGEQVDRSAVDSRSRDKAIACLQNVEKAEQGSGLTA